MNNTQQKLVESSVVQFKKVLEMQGLDSQLITTKIASINKFVEWNQRSIHNTYLKQLQQKDHHLLSEALLLPEPKLLPNDVNKTSNIMPPMPTETPKQETIAVAQNTSNKGQTNNTSGNIVISQNKPKKILSPFTLALLALLLLLGSGGIVAQLIAIRKPQGLPSRAFETKNNTLNPQDTNKKVDSKTLHLARTST